MVVICFHKEEWECPLSLYIVEAMGERFILIDGK